MHKNEQERRRWDGLYRADPGLDSVFSNPRGFISFIPHVLWPPLNLHSGFSDEDKTI
jgi:hypothetical protein